MLPPSAEALRAPPRPLGVIQVAPLPLPGPCGIVLRLRRTQTAEEVLEREGGGGGSAAAAGAAGAGPPLSSGAPRAIISLPPPAATGQDRHWWALAQGRPFVEAQREQTVYDREVALRPQQPAEAPKRTAGKIKLVLKP